MQSKPIRKPPPVPGAWRVLPNLLDYDAARKAFSWEEAARALDGLPGGAGLNLAHECVDRHVAAGRGARVALRWLGKRGERRDLSFAGLAADSSRFANLLGALGVARGLFLEALDRLLHSPGAL